MDAIIPRENHGKLVEIVGRRAVMWRSLRRQHLTFDRGRFSAMRAVFLAAIALIVLSGLAPEAWAQEEQLSKVEYAGQPVLIREHAGWNRNCEAVAHPLLYLSDPPRHGRICARLDNIKISSMFIGTESQCIGRLVRGVRLIYRADATYTGNDSLRYAAQYPSVLREIQVEVTVAANAASPSGPVPSALVAPAAPQVRQAPGPVPDCAEPIF